MGLFGLFVIAAAVWQAITGTLPGFEIMGTIGFAVSAANVVSALLLIGFREGDSNMRSVWLFSRNDAIGNVAVMIAAASVFATETGWPDVIVAGIMAVLALTASWQVVRHALEELRGGDAVTVSLGA
jgi:Co/Zn/Cd efflux system component